MKRKNLIIVLLITCVSLSFTQAPFHHVRFVYDGDTILISTGQKVRYLGIDAPEMGFEGRESEFLALASRNHNLQLVGKSRVKLEFDQERKDRHGRLLAYVFLENGEMVNAVLVRKGLAHVLFKRPNLKYRPLLLSHQRLAMREKLGIWRRDSRKKEAYYTGNSSSYRFHRPGCPFGRKIQNRHLVRLESRYEAFWEGFGPCKRCCP